jgi:hypothetical protein
MKGKGQTQGKGFGYVMAVPMAVLLIVAAKTVYDYTNAPFKGARTETYFAGDSEPFCVMEGVWYNWEEDETITLGCLVVNGNIREGSYSSVTGLRASSNFSMSGTYDIDTDDSMQVIGKDQDGKLIKATTLIHVDDTEYPTQMIVIDRKGIKGLYIWQRKE